MFNTLYSTTCTDTCGVLLLTFLELLRTSLDYMSLHIQSSVWTHKRTLRLNVACRSTMTAEVP